MKNVWIVLAVTATGLGGWSFLHAAKDQTQVPSGFASNQPVSGQCPVIVELFTSEGCSSCPPADKLLTSLLAESASTGQAVLPLSYHVDYWNYLGWKDPFSQSTFSDRQRRYANLLGSTVYTPQMVFNGQSETVGSDRTSVNALIAKASAKASLHTVKLETKLSADGKQVQVSWAVSGTLQNQFLQVALVESGLVVPVGRGENGGRSLRHDQVVRQLTSVELKTEEATGTTTLAIPTGVNLSQSGVVAFVQDRQSWEISGASQVALEQKEN